MTAGRRMLRLRLHDEQEGKAMVSKRTNEGCIAGEEVPSHALQLLLGFEAELGNAGPGLHRGVLLAGFLKWAKEEEVRH